MTLLGNMKTSTEGPWTRNGKGSWVCVIHSEFSRYEWEVEYRSAERSAVAGYYLFGFGFDGLLLDARSARLARNEAFARLVAKCPVVDFMDRLTTGERARS